MGEPPTYEALGMPLALWLDRNLVDPLTDGRHNVLREALRRLYDPSYSPTDSYISTQIDRSLTLYPALVQQLTHLRAVDAEALDMTSLIREPAELFVAENFWAGADYKAAKRRETEEAKEKALFENATPKSAAEYLAFAIQSHREAEQGGTTTTTMTATATGAAASSSALYVDEGPEVLKHALDFSAEALIELGRKDDVKMEGSSSQMETQNGTAEGAEDPTMRKIRLTLLALAKRAPLDKIAKLPTDLVPSHLRNIVPTQ